MVGTSGPVVSGPGHSLFRREPMVVGRNIATSLVVTLGEVGEAAVVAAHPLIVVPASVAVPRRAVQPPRFGRSIGIQRLPSDGMHKHCHFILLLLILLPGMVHVGVAGSTVHLVDGGWVVVLVPGRRCGGGA